MHTHTYTYIPVPTRPHLANECATPTATAGYACSFRRSEVRLHAGARSLRRSVPAARLPLVCCRNVCA